MVLVGQNICTFPVSVITRASIALLFDLDPMNQVEELKISQVIDDISGVYKSPHNLYELKIFLKGSVLFADIETDDGFLNYPLLPKQVENLLFTVCSTLPLAREGIRFIRDQTTRRVKFAIYDRYVYRKT